MTVREHCETVLEALLGSSLDSQDTRETYHPFNHTKVFFQIYFSIHKFQKRNIFQFYRETEKTNQNIYGYFFSFKGSGRLCKVVELSMQCCGKLL